MHRLSSLIAALLASLAMLASAPAHAVFGPLVSLDRARFVAATEEVQVVSVSIDVDQQPSQQGGATQWWVDAEVRLRNVSAGPITTEVAVLDDPARTDDTMVFVDGVGVATDAMAPRQDPAFPEHTYAHVRAVPLRFELGQERVVRASFWATGSVDAMGRTYVEIPTHALGLFASNIAFGHLRVGLRDRPIGLQATLSDPVAYDSPMDEVRWTLRDWSPTIPFRAAFSTPWTALLLVAEVEACPPPWDVVRSTTNGNMSALRSQLDEYDDGTLHFCANLPEVLHGRPFTSERTLESLGAMTLDRYVPGSASLPLYRPNPAWDSATLTEAEGIYSRALRSILDTRE